ncbi:MAG: hypothetical protein CFE41_03150 [Burkholderiales bacterium PBB2]|nr:MAG: hypothetical protein CFE41_03150 [Burkholderiales bacterium PBB2]
MAGAVQIGGQQDFHAGAVGLARDVADGARRALHQAGHVLVAVHLARRQAHAGEALACPVGAQLAGAAAGHLVVEAAAQAGAFAQIDGLDGLAVGPVLLLAQKDLGDALGADLVQGHILVGDDDQFGGRQGRLGRGDPEQGQQGRHGQGDAWQQGGEQIQFHGGALLRTPGPA